MTSAVYFNITTPLYLFIDALQGVQKKKIIVSKDSNLYIFGRVRCLYIFVLYHM